ncbi:CHAT domain-containing protein [Methylobacterium sp. WL69]|uniref:CHAT domain-containing protein n=1 Tax=Methylobacterium sp. WL69 TaxID=2603893 RepID=UPI0011CB70CF|nr:CHAT domain-containing protein [Methylobacterium sp. WL69]TXM73735.1 CHAT domain-containing protein [Methylobacterium sp. WL69]
MTTDSFGEWNWAWRKDGVRYEGRYLAFGLIDADGPPVEDEPWSRIRSSIYTLAREIFRLDVSLAEKAITLSGRVTSEKVKSSIAALFRGVSESLRNDLEVTAPFKSANVPWIETAAVLPAESAASLRRFPTVTPNGDARPGEAYQFEVDLAATPDGVTEGGVVEVKDLPAGWTEMQVAVEAFCDWIVFETPSGNEGIVTILSDGTSRPAVFRGTIRPDADVGKAYKLTVTFDQEGRHAGSAVRRIRIEKGTATGTPEAEVVAPAAVRGVELVRDVRSPILTIKIIEDSDSRDLTWSLSPERGPVPFRTMMLAGKINLKGDPADFARELLQTCPDLRPGRAHISVLRGIGETIWKATPPCFKELYAELRERHGPRFSIQIVTNEPHVPWEMMHPDAEAGFPDADHLFMTHPIARWFGGNEGGMRNGFERGRIVSFVPRYPPDSALPAAIAEGERLISEFGAVSGLATCDGLRDFLSKATPGQPVSMLHFAGHANPPGAGSDGTKQGLRMSDGWMSHREVHGGVNLGMEDGTFVMLNACSVGFANHTLGVVGGWPASLAMRGFGGILAPIWAVQDEHASSVVHDHMAGLLKGRTLGETMLDARVCYRNASATPFAYLCHGDVMARMS